MDTLLLIALNLIVVPFQLEAQALGRQRRRFPSPLAILRLARMRENPWLLPFLAFAIVLLVATLSAAPVGKWPQDLVVGLSVAFMQIVTWTMVILSIRKRARRTDAAVSYDALPSTI